MKDIKFRAYNKVAKKWANTWKVIKFNGRTMFWNEKVYDVSQFTGLKDKNGKEIYEGDILKAEYPAGYSLCEVKFGIFDNGQGYEDNESGNGWYIEEWGFYKDGVDDKDCNVYSLTEAEYLSWDLEVIGNRFENPEFIKGL